MPIPAVNHGSPTLCLAMIVRNENKTLPRCLASVLPFIDAWYIIDTGSTDNTVDIIHQQLEGIPGALSCEPFSSFSLLRANLFALAAKYADYVLMLDADEELLCLRGQILPLEPFDAARIEVRQTDFSLRQLRLFQSELELKFHGAVYERAVLPANCEVVDLSTSIIVHHADGYRSQQVNTNQIDVARLENELIIQPDTATRLALAQIYLKAQADEKANAQLNIIIRDDHAKPVHQWLAHYILGLQFKRAGQHEAALDAYLSAYDLDPSRAEALYRLAEILGHQARWNDAYQLTQMAIELPCPNADYFEPAIYDWWANLLHAGFCIELELFDEARKTLKVLPPARMNGDALAYRDKLKKTIDKQNLLVSTVATKKSLSTKKPKLSIAMATYDDFDGVYFTIASLLSGHPEVRDQIEIIVLDNNPSGVCAQALKDLCKGIDEAKYFVNDEIHGTAIRTHLFDYARGEAVLCIDCHVVILPGAIRKLIDYFEAHPGTGDLLQGPMINDNLNSALTHMEPRWHAGMFGYWPHKKQALGRSEQPFEIQVQGLGLYACRKDAWPGYNPRFTGFGGEEGYIHEKFRQNGHKILCLPFLRWMHRFARPHGVPYNPAWPDWIRNHLIGFDELDLDTQELEAHYADFIGFEVMARARAAYEVEKQNPLYYFDAIYCINLEHQTDRWATVQEQAKKLGIIHRLRRFSAIETPGNHHIGYALSHRAILQTANNQGFKNVLILEDTVIFRNDALALLGNDLVELRKKRWDLFCLGSFKEGKASSLSGESPSLYESNANNGASKNPDCTHAIAYHHNCFNQLLRTLPDTIEAMRACLPTNLHLIELFLAHDIQMKCYIGNSILPTSQFE